MTTMVDQAEARKRRGGYAPPYASIVVDANTGRVLQGTNPDALRFPASVTKVMTLYMLFEQIERGRFSLSSELPVSAFAARQAPSKIGFDPGETIAVEDAIKALITKSANDVAVVVAEAIGGDEETFAEMMTKKARSIGMSRTTFRNASGLPNPQQVTTARDLSILGRAIHERFPRYWRYFQTRNFEYAGRNYRNHNRLLGRVEGVDGIKTGYTRASGFNLLTSARMDNRHIIAVVLGGRSGRIRDAQMASLVDSHIERAHAGARTHSVLAEAREEAPVRVAAAPAAPARPEPRAQQETRAPAVPAIPAPVASQERRTPAQSQPQSRTAESEQQRIDNIRRAIANSGISAAPTRTVQSQVVTAPARQSTTSAAYAPQPLPPAPTLRWQTGAQPVQAGGVGRQSNATVAQADPVTTSSVQTQTRRSGIVIQIGASDTEDKARAILDTARAKNKSLLSEAEPFTESVDRNGTKLFRARFAGFDDANEANAACNALKRTGFACFVQRI